MSPPHFPIGPHGLRGKWEFDAIEPGAFSTGGCTVMAVEVPHKGGRTYGYRIEADGLSLAYLPDHNPAVDDRPGLRLVSGVDVLCHGGMFANAEHTLAHSYGHATLGEAYRLAREAGVGKLVLIHHAPTRTDEEVHALAGQLPSGQLSVVVGCEGDTVMGLTRH
jgi:ribonuclease BN (tRNA processing enzyme)